MSAITARRYTVEEYFELERSRDYKSEYFRGEIFAMSGGSEAHSLIASNVIRRVGLQLEERPCRVYTSDMRVKCQTGLYTYPDASIVCGKPELLGSRNDTLLNPLVIFEVLSETTEAYDRGKKFEHYMSIPSLRDYVLIPQDRPIVTRVSRDAEHALWTVTVASGLESLLELPSAVVSVPLRDIYAKIEFPPADEPSPINGTPNT
jgi:Uma2 family endonuclease